MIISIDGPAGSGKSTVARLVSEKLGFEHFNSGSLYRGITVYLVKESIDLTSTKIPKINLCTYFENGTQKVVVNGVDFTNELRNNEISVLTPRVSAVKALRNIVDNCQRNYAKNKNIIVDGRDIGSHVFPNADLKIYLDCTIQERARRRFLEEQTKGSKITIEEIEKQIAERDEIDRNKKIAPLVVPKGAIVIDSTNLTIDEVVDKIVVLYQNLKKQT